MSEKKFDILAAGLMVYDIIASPVGPSVFECDTTKIENIAFATGGDAFNVAVGAAKTGYRVLMGGVVGDDMPGKFLLDEARRHGVDTSAVQISDKYNSSVSVVLSSEDGQRYIAYYGKANDSFDGSAITDDMIASSSVLYIGSVMALKALEYGGLTQLFRRARSLGTLTALDSTWTNDGIWLPKFGDALPYTDIFIPSLYEAKEITGKSEPDDIIDALHKLGVSVAGVKLGADGVAVEDIRLPAFRCDDVIDTTGAGDAFMSGFVSAYSRGMSLYDCALRGSAFSNCCIRQLGATTALNSCEQIEETIRRHKDGMLK